jgi:hypothetical protein
VTAPLRRGKSRRTWCLQPGCKRSGEAEVSSDLELASGKDERQQTGRRRPGDRATRVLFVRIGSGAEPISDLVPSPPICTNVSVRGARRARRESRHWRPLRRRRGRLAGAMDTTPLRRLRKRGPGSVGRRRRPRIVESARSAGPRRSCRRRRAGSCYWAHGSQQQPSCCSLRRRRGHAIEWADTRSDGRVRHSAPAGIGRRLRAEARPKGVVAGLRPTR